MILISKIRQLRLPRPKLLLAGMAICIGLITGSSYLVYADGSGGSHTSFHNSNGCGTTCA